MEALGKVSSYHSNLTNQQSKDPKTRGREPGLPVSGFCYPCLYDGNMYRISDTYKAKIKVFIRNTWDWLEVSLRKSDVDYINKHCFDYVADKSSVTALRKRSKCCPTLQKRGKEWFLDFPIRETVKLTQTHIQDQRIAAIDLGINNACTMSIMLSDGTILGREFLSLPSETDSLKHAINRIKHAQRLNNRHTPRLWASANGINDHISVLTAHFIIDKAVLYDVDTIVFEHLDRNGKKKGSKKWKLHLWKSQYVQDMVTHKAHRLGMRVNHINAWGTSRLAFDGSGKVLRGDEAHLHSYSECRFTTGKIYNCDLNASYNIGSRYFIREILKSLPATARLDIEAKVPQCTKRSTCTLSTLISLNAVLAA